ncbi:hypothetical protein ADUPG1_012325, partial [Aduncisulcus paluster]
MTTKPKKEVAPLLRKGSVLEKKWKIEDLIGWGAFGQVFVCHHVSSREKYAVKCEPHGLKQSFLTTEVISMYQLQTLRCRAVPPLIDIGRTSKCNYFVTTLLGNDILKLKNSQPQRRFSIQTTLSLGIALLDLLQ